MKINIGNKILSPVLMAAGVILLVASLAMDFAGTGSNSATGTMLVLGIVAFLIGLYLQAMPDLSATAKGFLSVGLIWTVSSVVEFLVYTPMLGAGGGYLAFITGNLINMKIPCAMNARTIAGTKAGTPENLACCFCSPCSRFCRVKSSLLPLKMLFPPCSERWHGSITGEI